MSPFYKNFLRDGHRWFRSDAPSVHLAAFGKHPGWNDHMDDIGLDTDSLVTLKRILYLQGIAANISAGTWERLDESARLPSFNHVFRWQRGDQYLLGRMWSSRDGKGRAHFPMILCAHVVGSPAPPADEIRECLETTCRRCLETDSPEVVRDTIAASLDALRQLSPEADPHGGHEAFDIGDLPELAEFRRGTFRPRTNPPSKAIRVETATHDLNRWTAALQERLDPDAPILLTMPLHEHATWLDLIAGEPTPEDFDSLRTIGVP